MEQKEKFSLKDHLFNEAKVQKITKEIAQVHSSFKKSAFVKETVQAFPNLGLKERIFHIREMLRKYLPEDYKDAIKVLLSSLPEELDPTKEDDDFGDFIYAPYGDFVATYGKDAKNLKISLQALHEITRRFSCEDAIRSFINNHQEETLKTLEKWTKDKNYHVRRLVSEGTRPKLPWSRKIGMSIEKAIPLLDELFYDTTRYVTRSVANHMNDIAKLDPKLVLTTLKRWKASKKQSDSEMNFIIKHSLRTLVKEGNVEAFSLLGFTQSATITLKNCTALEKAKVGDVLTFSFMLESDRDTEAMIDYVMLFQNKSGKQDSKKVFKLKKLTLTKGEKVEVAKRHPLRAEMTTRTLYKGKHTVIIQVNSKKLHEFSFDLV